MLLGTFLTVSSCQLNPYAIDTDRGELVREVKGKIEIVPCTSEKAKEIACLDEKDQLKVRKCMRRQINKVGK